MDSALDNLEVKRKIKLSVTLIAAYLKKNYNQIDIARVCNVSKQAVNDYISRHYHDLAPLIDDDDAFLITQIKRNALKAGEKLRLSLDFTPSKKDLIPLNIVAGTQTQRYAELTGKTQAKINITYNSLSAETEKIAAELAKRGIKVGDTIDITPIDTSDITDSFPLAGSGEK